jgi:ppGpp synthetase/RelA/SpoT-type nucleotidyltranferase
MKISTDSIIREYDRKSKKYVELEKSVEYILTKGISDDNIKIHSIIHRIKSVNSFLDKMRKNNIEKPFEEICDIVGFRVVCLFISDLEKIRNIVLKYFDVFDEDDKVNDTELGVFGYMSIHLKARLKKTGESLSGDEICNVPFEVQIRTIAQDAWASISHHLDYKGMNKIPDKLKRDFYALSGLFYVADTHFLMLNKEKINSDIERKFPDK